MTWDDLMMKARQGKGLMRYAKPAWKALHNFRVPVVRPIAAFLYAERRIRGMASHLLLQKFYREPLLRYRCLRVGERLHLEGAIPQIFGNGGIAIGNDVRIGGRCTWIVGFKVIPGAELIIGDRVSINYQNVMSVAKSIRIGEDTMIAGNVQIYDNISHPLSPRRRLRHESFSPDEASPVVIGSNVWIGMNCLIMRGVTIGSNSVIAAGSIVTKSIPPDSLAAGSPARVIRDISDE